MFDIIRTNVLAPLFTRLGTLCTGGLIGIGANSTHADWVGTGIAGALFIATDLGLAWLRKRAIQRKAVNTALNNGLINLAGEAYTDFEPFASTKP